MVFPNTQIDLANQARQIRRSILDMIVYSGSSHIASTFSMVDILTVLYFDVLKIDPKNPKWEDRDRFFLSKGHGGAALYASLAYRGYAPLSVLSGFAQNGTPMAGHPVRDSLPGVEITAGSLGHGLSMAIGSSLALKSEGSKARVVVLLGDGECNEGTTWEGALAAAQFKLDNLLVIVDHNRQQGMGDTEKIMNMEPMVDKWRTFGWQAGECDGHDFTALRQALGKGNFIPGKPTVVIANTKKGKGVIFMEQDPLSWHYKTPRDNFLEQARKELGQNA